MRRGWKIFGNRRRNLGETTGNACFRWFDKLCRCVDDVVADFVDPTVRDTEPEGKYAAYTDACGLEPVLARYHRRVEGEPEAARRIPAIEFSVAAAQQNPAKSKPI